MGKIRYAKKDFQHPYKPWSDDHNDKEGKHYRGFKACQNCVEWTVYTVPSLWLYVLYTPALEVVPKVGPVVAPYLPLAGGAAAMVYSYFNVKHALTLARTRHPQCGPSNAVRVCRYVEGYMESAEGRLKPFYARTNAFKFLIYGAFVGIGASLADHTGLLSQAMQLLDM